MRIEDAQREMRDVYLGGSVGGFVSGALWLASAALGSMGSRQPAFFVVAAAMVGAGFVLPTLQPGSFAIGGWVGGVMLLLGGVWLGVMHAGELARRRAPSHSP